MRSNIKVIAGFVGAVVVVLTLLAMAPRPMPDRLATLRGDQLRIAEIYNRLDHDQRAVDVAFIGSSHTNNGIDDKGVEDALAREGMQVNVANLAPYGIGRDMQLMLAKELFATKQPKLVVLEVDDHESPNGHLYMPYVATAQDLVAPGIAWNLPQMFLLFLRQQLRGVADAALPGAPPASDLPQVAYGFRPIDVTWSGSGGPPVSAADNIERFFGHRARKLAERVMAPYGETAVEQIIALAHAHGASVMLLYLPEWKFALDPDPDVIGRYARWSPVFIIPRGVAQDKGNWWNAAHLNRVGATRLTPSLSAAIFRAMTATSANSSR